MSPLRPFLLIGLSFCAVGCAATDDETPDEATEDALLGGLTRVSADSVWMTFQESRDVAASLLPPELELAASDTQAGSYPNDTQAGSYPMVLVGQHLKTKVGAQWDEAVLFVPFVRFRAKSNCPSHDGEQFNYIVANYIGSRLVAATARLAFSKNRFYNDVQFVRAVDGYAGDIRVDGSTSLEFRLRPLDGAGSETRPALYDSTWNLPALAPGAFGKFARYRPNLETTSFTTAHGVLQTDEKLRGLRSRTVPFGNEGSAAALMKGTVEITDVHQCD